LIIRSRPPLKVRLKRLAHRSFLRMKRPRRCLDCGCLSFGDAEATRQDRELLNAIDSNLSLDNLHCFLSCWTDYAPYAWNEDVVLRELKLDRRGCPAFFRHRPGWTPTEHRDLRAKRSDTRRQIFLNVIGSFLGSALTLLVGWLAWKMGIK